MFEAKGVFLVNAGAASGDFMSRAGVTRIAHQLAIHGTDNQSTADNQAGMLARKNAWLFAEHGGWGVNGPDVAADVRLAVARIREHGLKFWIADTELYWLAGWNVALLTEQFITGMRAELGVGFPLAIISFGYSEHNWPGAAHNSGIDTCNRLGVAFIPEGYDGWGVTHGLEKFTPYYRREGVPAPSLLAIGDKSIGRDVDWLVQNPGNVSGLWVWAAEQASDTLPAIKAVTLTQRPVEQPKPVLLTQVQLNQRAWDKILAACREWDQGVVALGNRIPENGRIPHCKRIVTAAAYPTIQSRVDELLDSIGV